MTVHPPARINPLTTANPHSVDPIMDRQRLKHRVWLSVSAAIIAAAWLLNLHGSEGVGLNGLTLPLLCNMKRFTGLDCPGCGLTRSFISMAHGSWHKAAEFNAAGPIWFLAVAAQIPFRTWQLHRIRKGKDEFRFGRERLLVAGMFTLLLCAWIVKLLTMWTG